MSFFTKQEIQAIAHQKAINKGYAILSESRMFSQNTSTTSVFLSHSHHDKALIIQVKTFFENLGISIYVDWADETMPEKTNGITAQNIKRQIRENDKFVLLATNSAITSQWCNWEVGIGDSYKLSSRKIALLPLAENNGTWNGSEYLQIYPRIEKGPLHNDKYYIYYPDETSENLLTWLSK